MAIYRPDTCAYCSAETWCEIRANGKAQCRACKIERFYSEVLYPPLGFSLIAWQRKALRDLYGTVNIEDGAVIKRLTSPLGRRTGNPFSSAACRSTTC